MATPSEYSLHEEFLRLLSGAEGSIRRYIVTLIPNYSDVDDIMQETLVALWRRFGEYRRDQPFEAWAFRFAYYQVLSHRKRNAVRSKHLTFSDSVVQSLAADQEGAAATRSAELDALSKCVESLTEEGRELLKLRYATNVPVSKVARDTNQPAKRLYQALERVRMQLVQCVRMRLSERAPS